MNRETGSRDLILEAAEAVVAKAGAAHLTLEAVAAKAGLSKGGLLYHFPSKAALLQGMIARCLERVDHDEGQLRRELGSAPAADLQARILAGFKGRPEQEQIAAALLAAGANDPKLLDPVRAWHARQFQQMARSKRHPMRAAVIILALDGLWLNELLETSPLKRNERKKLMEELIELAKTAI